MRLLVLSLMAACGSGGGFPDARPIDAPPPKGMFSLAWAVTDSNGGAVTCDQLGAHAVTVITHNRAVDGASTQVFVCSTLAGTSAGLDPGTYDMDFELDGDNSTQLAVSPTQHGIVIQSEQTVALGALTFAVQATGNIALNLSTGRTGGNCAAAPGGGAITATQITLTRNSDLTCNPLALTIGTNATHPTPTPYMISCTAPVNAACIENDQSITATGVAADSYTIHVKGIEGTVAMPTVGPTCWSNNDSLVVPPLGATLTRTLNLGFASTTAGCM